MLSVAVTVEMTQLILSNCSVRSLKSRSDRLRAELSKKFRGAGGRALRISKIDNKIGSRGGRAYRVK